MSKVTKQNLVEKDWESEENKERLRLLAEDAGITGWIVRRVRRVRRIRRVRKVRRLFAQDAGITR